ncbi:MAG: DUF1129 domain-containing protein [Acidobacteriota bacterium]|nr:DUF1129 domain-containing protein [Acidobacteriota bacterium]MDH3785752.1 DUF1129 domain-containing protein [Acidobacteriota bacterium]
MTRVDPASKRIRNGLVLLVWVAFGCQPTYSQTDCPAGNVLGQATIKEAYDAYHTERLTDGVLGPEGGHWLSDRNTLFTSMGYVVFELPQTIPVHSIFLQADANDSYRLSGSTDGRQWQPLEEIPAVGPAGMQMRYATGFDFTLRFLRVEPGAGDGDFSIGEIAAYCGTPTPWPPAFERREGTVRDGAWSADRKRRLALWKSGLGVVGGLILLVVAHRSKRSLSPLPYERALLVAIAISGGLAWINFGTFHGPNVVHLHDTYHYVMGAKYFPENRYTGLYHCSEVAEAESGRRSFVERRMIRNLETNVLESATRALAASERCHQAFSPERWKEFTADVEFYRSKDYPGSWSSIFRDHGYNATPVWTAAGRLVVERGSMSQQLGWLAALDFAFYVLMFGAIAWAFGLQTTALAALVWGIGFPWQYDWTGGAFGRTPWILFAVLSICLLHRSRFRFAGFALGVSTLLRAFPSVLVAGPLLIAGRDLLRRRKLTKSITGLVVGGLLAVVVGVSFGALSDGGLKNWSGFSDNLRKHSASPLGNHVGLRAALSWSPSNTQSKVLTGRLDDFARWEKGRHDTFAARRPVYFIVAAALVGLFAWFVLRTRRAEWETVAAGILPLMVLTDLASYYLIAFILLVPFASGRPRRIAWFVGTVVVSQLLQLLRPSVDTLFFMQSVLFLIAITAVVLMRNREP